MVDSHNCKGKHLMDKLEEHRIRNSTREMDDKLNKANKKTREHG